MAEFSAKGQEKITDTNETSRAKPAQALLSASSSHRWLNCPPSALLCADKEDMGSIFAQEGTDAHALCEYKVRRLLGENAETPVENLTYYDAEMAECAENYAAYISELITDAKKRCNDPIILVEQRLDFSGYVPDGFGTGDCVVVADDTLEIVDFKYGRGVEVSAVNNPQMMLYALGALTLFDSLYDITQVSMTIFQPRLNNLSNSVISKAELLDWAETALKPAAALAAKGEGGFRSGDWCRFCKIKAECRKRAGANLELAKLDFAPPATLDNTEIAESSKRRTSLRIGLRISRNMLCSRLKRALSLRASSWSRGGLTESTLTKLPLLSWWKRRALIPTTKR